MDLPINLYNEPTLLWNVPTLWYISSVSFDPKIKPDGVERGLIGEIIKRFETKGFQLVALRMMKPSQSLLEEHYADLKTKSFFPGLMAVITTYILLI